MLNNWEKKEKPIQGIMGMGGGATGYLVGGSGGGFQVTGGTQTVIGDYLFIEFENGMPGTFTVDSGEVTDGVILMAGGGGAGGSQVGGGGGGGGLIHRTSAVFTPGTYTYSVGYGGQHVIPAGRNGNPGGDTTLTFPGSHPYGNITNRAKGGGGGGGHQTPGARPGGSGGGGGAPPTGGGSATQPSQSNPGWNQYGHAGGTGRNSSWAGGGGGGAGSTGNPSPGSNSGGPGGNGRAFPGDIPPAYGDNGYFCGGGGGCRNQTSGASGGGGPGGGGRGRGDENTPNAQYSEIDGQAKTGGGGGGNRDAGRSGNGGTGVIIIRVPTAV